MRTHLWTGIQAPGCQNLGVYRKGAAATQRLLPRRGRNELTQRMNRSQLGDTRARAPGRGPCVGGEDGISQRTGRELGLDSAKFLGKANG